MPYQLPLLASLQWKQSWIWPPPYHLPLPQHTVHSHEDGKTGKVHWPHILHCLLSHSRADRTHSHLWGDCWLHNTNHIMQTFQVPIKLHTYNAMIQHLPPSPEENKIQATILCLQNYCQHSQNLSHSSLNTTKNCTFDKNLTFSCICHWYQFEHNVFLNRAPSYTIQGNSIPMRHSNPISQRKSATDVSISWVCVSYIMKYDLQSIKP